MGGRVELLEHIDELGSIAAAAVKWVWDTATPGLKLKK